MTLVLHNREARHPRDRRLNPRASFLRLAVVGLIALSLGTVFAGPVQAESGDPLDCESPVVDTSGQVNVKQVEDALADVDPEATVVVRAFESVPNGELVTAVDEIVLGCFSSEDGTVLPEVILLGLSTGDRRSDVLVGARWGAAVPDPDGLRENTMGTRFATGNFTGGLVAAIGEIADGVETQLAEGTTELPVDGSADTAPVEVETAPTPTPAGGGQSPLAIAGGLIAIGACGGAFYTVNRYRRRSTLRQHLQKAMAGPTARVGVLRERQVRLENQADLWATTTAGRTKASLRGLRRAVDDGRRGVDRDVTVLSDVLPDGPRKADETEIERGQRRVIELSRSLDRQDEALDQLTAFGAHLDYLRVSLPAKQDLLIEETGEAQQLVEQRRAEGWAVDTHATELKDVRELVETMYFDRFEVDLLAISERIERAEARLFAVGHQLQSLPSRAESLQRWNTDLNKAADLELRRTEEFRRQFSVLAASHASDSWQWVADHPEQAIVYLDKANEIQERATALIAEQRFDDAGSQLDAAGLQLIAADHLLDQVDDLLVDLHQAREECPVILAQAREILADLRAFIDRHGNDLHDSFDAVPSHLSTAIDGLEVELRQVKPNYLRVAESGDRINRRIDELLVEAKDEHAEAQAFRREAARETARATRAIARSRRALGWELFKSSDGQALDHLEGKLRGLPSDPAAAIEAAGHIADDALRIQERVIARRRRHGTWITTGGGGWVSGGGGWSRGGGGSVASRSPSGAGRSFGSRSSSFGGRSFGGGRSSGSF